MAQSAQLLDAPAVYVSFLIVCAVMIFRFVLLSDVLARVMAEGSSMAGCYSATSGADELQPVTIERTTLAGVPAILRSPERITRPPVILWHGLGPPGDKEELMAALPLDDVPAVKVYLDLPLFGERLPEGGLSELSQRQARDYGLEVFAPVVLGAVEELPAVVEQVQLHFDNLYTDGLSLFGFSAGGAAVLLALAERDIPIRSAVVLNAPNGLDGGVEAFETITGSTYEWSDDARSLAAETNAVIRANDIAGGEPRPAILLLHGRSDEMIPPSTAEEIGNSLKSYYGSNGEHGRLRVDLVDNLEHHWAGQDSEVLDPLRQQIGAWLRCH